MKIYGVVVISLFTLSCAHTGDIFRNSVLSNQNQAPEKVFSAKEVSNNTIDEVHLRTKADYHYSLAESLSLEGNSKRAIEEFKMTLVYDPKSSAVMTRLAAEYLRSGLVNEALEHAQDALKITPDHKEARILLGGIYTSLKMYDSAENQYRYMLKLDSQNQEAHIYLGALLAEQKKFKESKKVFRELARNSTDEYTYLAHYYLARVYQEEGGKKGLQNAIRSLEKCLDLKPSYGEAVVQLARIYQQKDNLDKVIEVFLSHQDNYGPLAEGAEFLSQFYLQSNQLDKAYEQLQFMEGFQPQDLNIKTKMALILVQNKDFNPAADKLEAILAIDPTLDKIRFYLGAVYEELKLSEKALKQYAQVASASDFYTDSIIHSVLINKKKKRSQQALDVASLGLKKRKDVPELYTLKASLLNEIQAYTDSKTVLSQAQQLFPKNSEILFMFGSVLGKLGLKGEAISQMENVLNLNSEHVQALNYLAYMYADAGEELDRAMKFAKKAISLKPEDAYILDTIGWIYFKKGDLKMAIQFLEKAHRVKPNESIVAEHLGDAYYKYQLAEKARKMYKLALELTNEDAKLDRIQTKLSSVKKQLVNPGRVPASN